MKLNEIGHFQYCPPKNRYDHGGYPEQLMGYNQQEDCIVWKPNFKLLGETDIVELPEDDGVPESTIIDGIEVVPIIRTVF